MWTLKTVCTDDLEHKNNQNYVSDLAANASCMLQKIYKPLTYYVQHLPSIVHSIKSIKTILTKLIDAQRQLPSVKMVGGGMCVSGVVQNVELSQGRWHLQQPVYVTTKTNTVSKIRNLNVFYE